MVNCKHWSNCNVSNGGCCALKLFGERPSEGTCKFVCDKKEETLNYPSLAQEAKNIISSAKRVAQNISSGQQVLATNEEYNRRNNICQTCPLYDLKQNRCSKCGCYLKAKLRLATEHCPLNKW